MSDQKFAAGGPGTDSCGANEQVRGRSAVRPTEKKIAWRAIGPPKVSSCQQNLKTPATIPIARATAPLSRPYEGCPVGQKRNNL